MTGFKQSKCVHSVRTTGAFYYRRNMISVVFYVCFAALTVTPCFQTEDILHWS